MNKVFSGGDLHKKIYSYFPPITWCQVLSRVSTTWKRVSRCNELWYRVYFCMVQRVPALNIYNLEHDNTGTRGIMWCAFVYVMVKRFISAQVLLQIAKLHIPPILLEQKALKVHDVICLMKGTQREVIFSRHRDIFQYQVRVPTSKFVKPLRSLILHGEINPEDSVLHGNEDINRLVTEVLAKVKE